MLNNTTILINKEHRQTVKILKSKNLAYNIENKFLDNFTSIFHRILKKFFNEDNFEFIDGKIKNLAFQDIKGFLERFLSLISNNQDEGGNLFSLAIEEEKAIIRNIFKMYALFSHFYGKIFNSFVFPLIIYLFL